MSPRRAAALCLLLACFSVAAQPPTPPAKPEEMKLPADAILVLYDKAADALRALPKFYLLSPERYNTLVAEIDKLNKQLQGRQPAPISTWKVTGKVRGNVADLKATFAFVTERDRATVALACSRGFASTASLDGKVAPLWLAPEGLHVEVEKKGEHEAVVELLVPLKEMQAAVVAPGGRPEALLGFDLDLPLTPVTSVEVDLPAGVKAVEVNDQVLREPLTLSGNRLSGPVGRKGLKVAWKAPQPATGPVALLTARGWIKVQFKKDEVVTEARLTLQDLGRAAKEWRLQVPDRAQVSLASPADRDRLSQDLRAGEIPDGQVTIPLAAPTGEPLTVVVTRRRPRTPAAVEIGPFAVLGATEQRGVVWVVAEPDQRATCAPYHPARPVFRVDRQRLEDQGETSRPEKREPAPDGAIAAFQYGPGTEGASVRDPWFKVDTDIIQGMLDITVQHTLKLGDRGAADARLTSRVDAVPLRNEVDLLELDWPAPWQIDPGRDPRTSVVRKFREDLAQRRLKLFLDLNALQSFSATVEALPADAEGRSPFASVPDWPTASAVLPLPRPIGGRNRGKHQVTVLAPKLDLRVPQPPGARMELVIQEAHRLVWHSEEFVPQVAVAWKEYRPDVRVKSVVDIVLAGSKIEVRQQMTFDFEDRDQGKHADEVLRVPPEVRWLRRAGDNGKPDTVLAPADERGGRGASPGERLVRCPLDPVPPASLPKGEDRKTRGPTRQVVLRYEADLSAQHGKDSGDESPRRVPVPLVAAAAATQGEVRVRVWAEPGSHVRAAERVWEETGLEIAPDRPRLPSLVVWGLRPVLPLTLLVEAPRADAGHPSILVGGVLIQVRVGEGGFQQHRARFLIRELATDRLDLAFPAPLSSVRDLHVTLGDKAVSWDPVEAAAGDDGRPRAPSVARLRLPAALPRYPAALEVSYQLAPSRGGFASALQTVFQPVTIPDLPDGVPVRWQLDLPPSWVPLPLEGDAAWSWGRRGWLLAPRAPVNNGDLERWFWGEKDDARELPDDEAALVPSHVCWQSGQEPLRLYHAPQTAWLLCCSLAVLLVGLTLGHAAMRTTLEQGRGWLFHVLLCLLAAAVVGVGLLAPGLLVSIVYGAEPGLAVLLVVLLVQWLLQHSYRRRVVFLPGFRRVKAGSSQARLSRIEGAVATPRPEGGAPAATSPSGRGLTNTGQRLPKEPSTVDAPLPEGGQL